MAKCKSSVMRAAILEDDEFFMSELTEIVSKLDFVGDIDGFSSNSKFFECFTKLKYDLVLADISLDDGESVDFLGQFKILNPSSIIVVISASFDGNLALRSIKIGASAFIHKSDEPSAIVDAIARASRGESIISPSIAHYLCLELQAQNPKEKNDGLVGNRGILTIREFEVLILLSKGFSNSEMALHLGLSINTVPVHVRNIYRKLQTRNRAETIYEARIMGLLN